MSGAFMGILAGGLTGAGRLSRPGTPAAALAAAALLLPLAACQDTASDWATPYAAAGTQAGRTAVATIPFGPAAGPRPEPAAGTVLGANFEFVEDASGYALNAVVHDRTRGRLQRVRIDHCRTIDLDSFDESSRSLFATPAICDGRSYAFDLVGTRVVVTGPKGRSIAVYGVAAGRVVLNGVPVLAGA